MLDNFKKYDSFLELVRNRRTTRQFRPDPVPDDYITKIIEAARWAPSAFHTQPWEFVVVKNPEVKEQVIAALDQHGPAIKDPAKKDLQRKGFRDAPVFILALCDWRARAGLPGPVVHDRSRISGLYDSSMANAFLYMHLAAVALGLASQWYTATSRPEAEKAIKKIIGIPEELSVYDMMVLGYKDAAPVPKIVRETPEMIHYDNCGEQDFRTDEEAAEYARITKEWCMSAH